MTEEIEIKILEIDKEKVISKLEFLGAKKFFEGDMKDLLFDNQEKTFQNDEVNIRLRDRKNVVKLAYKKKLKSDFAKHAREIEFEVSDLELTKEFMQAIGFQIIKKAIKHRVSYELEGVLFEFDTFEDIPTWLEIEAQSEEIINDWIDKLELDRSKIRNWGTNKTINYYKKIKI